VAKEQIVASVHCVPAGGNGRNGLATSTNYVSDHCLVEFDEVNKPLSIRVAIFEISVAVILDRYSPWSTNC